MRSKSLSLITLALGMVFLASCTLGPPPPLRVGASIRPGYEGFYLARNLGFYDGQPIKMVEYTSTPEVVRAFKHGALEAIALTGDELIRLSLDEPNINGIAVLDISIGGDALVAKPGIKTLPGLKGKRIGVEVNSVGIYMLTRALQHAGLKLTDVQVVPVENFRQGQSFAGGEVDAVVTFEPTKTQLVESGGVVLFDSSMIKGEVMDFLVVSKAVLRERPEDLKLLLAGWFRARDFLMTKREEAAAIAAKREGITTAHFLKALEALQIPDREESRRLLLEMQTNPASPLQTIADVIFSSGLITNKVAATNLLYSELQ